MSSAAARGRSLIYLVPNDAYFLSHRLPMARAAMEEGFSVALVTGSEGRRAEIEAQGVRVILCPFLTPGGMNPWREAQAVAEILWIYRTEKPALVHHITLKSILYGSFAAWLARVPAVVNAFAGLGYIFVSDAPLAKSLRLLLFPFLWFLLRRRGSFCLFQNPDDLRTLEALGLCARDRAFLIPGSGVDPEALSFLPFPDTKGGVVCVYAGRMIGIKGLETLRLTFEILAEKAPEVSLWLCGAPDPANPGSWSEERLRAWQEGAPNVRWLGHRRDMAEIWGKAHIALQPSYGGEGIPRALLEAACHGRPIVASDVPGCREAVDPERSGVLVPPRDAQTLAGAIESLARDPQRMGAFGAAGRRLVEVRGLTSRAVADATRRMYRRIVQDERCS